MANNNITIPTDNIDFDKNMKFKDAKFRIQKHKKYEACYAIWKRCCLYPDNNFPGVDIAIACKPMTTLDEIMNLFGWKIFIDINTGDYCNIMLSKEKTQRQFEDIIFSLIAKYVDSGSYIHMVNPINKREWKWMFLEGSLLEVQAAPDIDTQLKFHPEILSKNKPMEIITTNQFQKKLSDQEAQNLYELRRKFLFKKFKEEK